MSFQIIVSEIATADGQSVERYRQTVDVLELGELINVINRKPRKPRVDRGTKRGEGAK